MKEKRNLSSVDWAAFDKEINAMSREELIARVKEVSRELVSALQLGDRQFKMIDRLSKEL